MADGWIFYTPAYKAALRARGIVNPYQRMLEPNVELITFTRNSSEGMLRIMQEEIYSQTGTRVSFELAAEVPNYAFWRIIPSKTEQ